MWHIDDAHEPDGNWIEIRTSQHKNNVATEFVYEFEIINVSGPSASSRIGAQMLRVLLGTQEGTSKACIAEAVKQAQGEQAVIRHQELAAPPTPAALRRALEQLNNSRGDYGRERSTGAPKYYADRELEDVDMLEWDAPDPDPTSGRPSRNAAQAIYMLDSGFDPASPWLKARLKVLERVKAESEEDAKEGEASVQLLCSGIAYAIVDSRLQPGEVFYQRSSVSSIV